MNKLDFLLQPCNLQLESINMFETVNVIVQVSVESGATTLLPEYEIEMISFSYEDESIDFSDSRYVIDRTGKRYLTSLSCLLVARSKDGINFEYDYDNYIKPFNKYHSYGLEDARIVEIEGDYVKELNEFCKYFPNLKIDKTVK